MPRTLNHVGFAVPSLEPAMALFRDTFGARLTPIIEDPIQRVRLCFAEYTGGRVELIEPLGPDSPVSQIVARSGGGLYHLCFETSDLEAEFASLRKQGFIPTGPPQPAVAFDGRRVAFLFHKTAQLIELVEVTGSPGD
ncbi:MAG: VOC family protein [Chloroflexi bacterium]|nr:VOC family protein [Chloroflexota bacterium]MBV9544969.1 VOC family protein [Chloroflexota bacterium]